jgi:serine/threonine protein kinase
MRDDAPSGGLRTIPSTVLAIAAKSTVLTPPTGNGDHGSGAATALPNVATTSEARYEWVALLGEGGMGRVERLRDRDLLRDVAVKHLLPELRGDADLLGQFLWEARVTAYLDHPNIVPVHDLGVTGDGQLYFTMKFVRGATLEDKLDELRAGRGDELTRNRRLRLFLQLCSAVAFAHSRGVLHRDLKPANVLLGEYGEVLVGDWGLAVPLPGQDGQDVRVVMPEGIKAQSAGTPSYMSPEQARGEALDPRSDVYTLGVILYELVSLTRAFEGPTVAAILAKVVSGEHASLLEVAPNVSTSMASVVAKAMALDPEKRYEDVAALAREVETVLDGRTPDAEHASYATQFHRYYKARDPGMSRLRVVDVDMWMASAMLLGAGIAVLVALFLAPRWWMVAAALVASLVVGYRPTVRWLKLRENPDDDG